MLSHAAAKYLAKLAVWVLSGLSFLLLNGCTGAKPVTDASGLISYATELQGIPYRFGGAEPGGGFDCSGFVRHVYARFGVPLPRTTREMADRLPAIPLEQCESGDLLFFHVADQPFSHVGLYLGEGRFIHAPSIQSGGVMISSLKRQFWRERFAGARRPAPPPGQ